MRYREKSLYKLCVQFSPVPYILLTLSFGRLMRMRLLSSKTQLKQQCFS